jgi:hypothetical protein
LGALDHILAFFFSGLHAFCGLHAYFYGNQKIFFLSWTSDKISPRMAPIAQLAAALKWRPRAL